MPNYGAYFEDPELDKLKGRRIFAPPEIDPELEAYGAGIGAREEVGPLPDISMANERVAAMPSGGGPVAPDFASAFSPSTQFGPTTPAQPGIAGAAPLIMSMGAELMGGKQTSAGTVGNILAGGAQSYQYNAAMRKMLNDYIARGGGGGGFQSSSELGIPDLQASGLTPQQIESVYTQGMKLRGEERKWPLEQMGTLAEISSKLASGELHAAQIPYYTAMAEDYLAQAKARPAATRIDILKKLSDVQHVEALIGDLKRKGRMEPFDIAKTQAETINLGAQTVQRFMESQKITKEIDPTWIKNKAEIEETAKRLSIPYHFENYKGNIIVFDTQKNKWFASHALPGAGELEGEPAAAATRDAFSLGISDFVKDARDAFVKNFPEGEQKGVVAFQQLLSMLKDPTAQGNVALTVIRSLLPENKKIALGAAVDVYRAELRKTDGSIERATVKAKQAIDRVMRTMAKPATREDINRIWKASGEDAKKARAIAEKEGLDISGWKVKTEEKK